jgi:hypothetical protein
MAGNKSTRVSKISSNDKKALVNLMISKELSAKRGANTKLRAEVTALQNAKKMKPPQQAIRAFGGVTQMDIAPVSIGNSIRSVKQELTHGPNNVRIVGRDYVTTIGGTSTGYTTFTFQCGMGLSPVSLNASGLRGFFTSYEKFRWNKAVAHYITSSPTSTSGDILMFYHSNHAGPKVNHTSTNFLAYALSTDAAVLGPQWTNHSVNLLEGPRPWLDTDLFNAEDVQHQADGELLVYTRNTTNGTAADSPGYLLIDYDITFQSRMLNPRVQTIPSSLFKWFPTSMSYVAGVSTNDPFHGIFAGANIDGTTASLPPTGAAIGDIFQVVFDPTNAVTTNFSPATGVSVKLGNANNTTVFPIVAGTTIYGVITSVTGTGDMWFYPTYDSVFGANYLMFNFTNASVTFQCPIAMCGVGSANAVYTQASIG